MSLKSSQFALECFEIKSLMGENQYIELPIGILMIYVHYSSLISLIAFVNQEEKYYDICKIMILFSRNLSETIGNNRIHF